MSKSNQSLREIFNAAVEIEDPAQRGEYLAQACGADTALRQSIEELIAANHRAGRFLGGAADTGRQAARSTAGGTALLAAIAEQAGDKIGRYKLLQKIGEGGCGVVYMAEQEEPVRRRVALKVIKLGMDTKSVIARFEAERQALALMDHPNIAKVLDAGATDAGRPYFVMELVRGIRITDYCDQNNLPTHQRLDLFTRVCHAIQHAHQKGIIHRDIKPSNILVTLHDGQPVPKVIDFGIVKAIDQRLTEKTLFTAFEQFIGTPAYMSPEQAEMSGLDIDTRSDIYALGVLLYELLTGKTPFDGRELLAAGLDGMRRTIREQEPMRPSTRLSTMLAADLTVAAKHRQCEPAKLTSSIRGDLDWIVMKALEKDRTRRYDTANGLALDLQRHLNNEPVVARPPTNLYRFQKMARRNKLAFAAVSAVAAALIIGFSVSTWMFLKEQAARRRADAAEKAQNQLRQQAEIATAQETSARQQAEIARAQETNARRQAETNAVEIRKLLRREYVAKANAQSERGDVAGSLPWLVEALKLASSDDQSEEAIRINFGTALGQLPALDGSAFLEIPKAQFGATNDYHEARSGLYHPVVLSSDCRLVAIARTLIAFRPPTTMLYRSYIVVCDTTTGKPLTNRLMIEGHCQSLTFSPDGRLVVAAAADAAYVWEVATGELIAKLEGKYDLLEGSPGHYTNESGFRTERTYDLFPGLFEGSASPQFSSDGNRLLLVSQSGAVAWDMTTRQQSLKVPFNFKIGARFHAQWSPNGRYVFYRARNAEHIEEAWVRDLVDQQRFPIPTPNAWINSVEFSPNGKLMVCFYSDLKSFGVVDLQSGNRIKIPVDTSSGATNALFSAVFSPDSSQLILADSLSPRRISTSSWRGMEPPLPHSDFPMRRIVFSPDSRKIVTASSREALQVWDAQTGQPLTARFERPGLIDPPVDMSLGEGVDIKFSRDGRFLVMSEEATAWRWNLEENEIPSLASTNPVSVIQFSPDGKRVLLATVTDHRFSGLMASEIRRSSSPEPKYKLGSIWNVETRRQITTLGSDHRFHTASFSSDGSRILTESPLQAGPTNQVWDPQKGPQLEARETRILSLWDAAQGVAITTNIEVSIWPPARFAELTVQRIYPSQGKPAHLKTPLTYRGNSEGIPLLLYRLNSDKEKVSPAVKFYLLTSNDSKWDEDRPTLELNDVPTYASLDAEGSFLIFGAGDNSVRVYAVTNGAAVGPFLPHPDRLVVAALTHDHRQLATLCRDRTLRLWDLATGSLRGILRETNGPTAPSLSAFSGDDRYVAILGHDFTTESFGVWRIYDLKDMQSVFAAPLPPLPGLRRWEGRGETKNRNFVRVVDRDTRQPIEAPLNHEATVRDVQFSPNERLVATVSEDKTARVWLAETGEAITPPLRHAAPVTACAFSPDGLQLVTGTSDGTARIWNLRPTLDSAADLQLVAELYAGRRLDRNHGLVPLDPEQSRSTLERWQTNQSRRFPSVPRDPGR